MSRQHSGMEWLLLAGVPAEDVRALVAAARRRSFRRGEVVVHRDDPGDSLHLIVHGRFAVRITTPLGDTVILDVLGPGDAFGELALLLPQGRHPATVEALETGETRSLFREAFAALQRKHPGVRDVLLRLLAGQVARLSDRLVQAHYVDAGSRLRSRLVELADRAEAPPGRVTLPLTQEELAALAGTSRATVNRVLRDEERRGTIALGRGRVTVLDPELLRQRSGAGWDGETGTVRPRGFEPLASASAGLRSIP